MECNAEKDRVIRVKMIKICSNIDGLSRKVALFWVKLAKEAERDARYLHVALAGGSTPKHLYQLLAQPEFAQQMPWESVHIYMGDERSVPHDHADSNYRMAQETFLEQVPIPTDNIHPMDAAPDPEAGARAYEQLLTTKLPLSENGVPIFDLILLGLGPDGHTASLFPDTTILQEKTHYVAAVYVEKLKTWRVSLTFPVINQARHVLVMASGEGKAAILEQIMDAKNDEKYPVQMIEPQGDMIWYLDRAAASLLSEST